MPRRPYRRDTPLEEWIRAGQEPDLELPLPGPDGKPSETLKMRFRRVPAGSFLMGSREGYGDEEPPHRVEVDEFWLGKFVVTQEEWAAVAGLVKWPEEEGRDWLRPSHFKGDRLPVENVSWFDAQLWLEALQRWMRELKGTGWDGRLARLPAEAEWEYACRAGSRTEFGSGDGKAALAEVGWFDENSANTTHRVDEVPDAGKPGHVLGLVGMHGNVWELCDDPWTPRHVAAGVRAEESDLNPVRVIRGGSWCISAGRCRSADRFRWGPGVRGGNLGFRVCLVRGPEDQKADRQTDRGTAGAGKPQTRDGSEAHGTGRPEGKLALASEGFSGGAGRSFFARNATETLVWGSPESEGFFDFAALAGRNVRRLIVDPSPGGGVDTALRLSLEQLDGLWAWLRSQPTLRCLHLWNVAGIERLRALPEGLECLDVRHCPDLQALEHLPATLEFLWQDGCGQLARVPAFPAGVAGLPVLEELSVRGCGKLPEAAIHGLMRAAPDLRWVDVSECLELRQIARWPSWLERVELNDCPGLRRLPEVWPDSVRRVGLRNARALEHVPDFVTDPEASGESAIDWLDLRGTTALRKLPAIPWSLRTLYLFGSGVPLAPELFGEDAKSNVAAQVIPFLRQDWGRPRVPDNEVKVILLGNGRCGKTSLARRWIENRFNPGEPSTHGVHHWMHRLKFEPVDGGEPEEAIVHVWDFAGQDLYHNTHRLFLQSRAVFVICGTDQPPAPDPDEPEDELTVLHPPGYWLDQVRSLGPAPGMDGPPPILLVRTQAEASPGTAYWGRIPAEAADLPRVDFEASTDDDRYRSGFEARLQQAVAQVLGRRERREYPESVLALKREISVFLAKNDAEYREAEAARRPARSPHPTMARRDFDTMAMRLCPGYPTDRLLELLHRSGLVFHPGERLPEVVILDQRWATDALYVLTERGSPMREHLLRHRGIATAADFSRLAWSLGPTPRQPHRVRYGAQEQAQFLSFMQECGMCFELVPAGLARGEEAVFAVPGFLPSADEARPDPAGDSAAWGAFRFEDLPESAAQSATVYLGRYWRRTALLWRWGGRVKAARSGSVLEVNWVRRGAEAYTGTLELRFLGVRDAAFAVEVMEEVSRLIRRPEPAEMEDLRREAGTREMWVEAETPSLSETRIGDRRTAKPEVEEAVGVTVGFSYAGGGTGRALLGMIPRRAGEMLVERLQQGNREGTVLLYDKHEGEARLNLFMEQIAKGDLAVMFWSRPYWESHYCLAEAVLIHGQRRPQGFAADDVVVFVINGERVSSGPTVSGKPGPWNHGDFERYWREKAERRLKEEEQKAGAMTVALANLKREPFDAWYETVQSHELAGLVADFLNLRRLNSLRDPVDAAVAEAEARKVCEVLAGKLGLG